MMLVAGLSALAANSTILVVSPLDSNGEMTALDFYAPDRGILDSISFYIPESWGASCLDDVTVNVIGRGDVAVEALSEQSIGRQGSLSPRRIVGEGKLVRKSRKGYYEISLYDLDLRPDNGVDVRFLLKGVRSHSQPVKAVWSMSTPVLPDSVQGEL